MPIDFVLLLLSAAIRALALGLVTFVGLFVVRIQSSAARHATWTVVLIGMLLEIPLGILPGTVSLKVLPTAATPTGALEVRSLRPSLPASVKLPRALAPALYQGTEAKGKRLSSIELLSGAYLAISILLLVRMALGLWGLRAISEGAKPIPGLGFGIFESDSLAVAWFGRVFPAEDSSSAGLERLGWSKASSRSRS